MSAPEPSETIDVRALRVGMYVHLDVGWLKHPFPVSNFRIASADELVTLRGLGLKRVRWSRSLSDAAGGASSPAAGSSAGPPDPAPPPEAATPEAVARADLKRRLAAQRAAVDLAERQFAEAAEACRQCTSLVTRRPREARRQAEALTEALLAKLLPDTEVSIRILTEAAGDKASLHALNVGIISLLMGKRCGLSPTELHDLGVGALLHDIGKLELPERVRHHDEHFTPAERRFYEDHVQAGVQMARRMGLSAGAGQVVAQHHERADGSGFPDRLTSDGMSVAARIVALVNRYDNLCNPPLPARALTPHEALSLVFAQGKTQHDMTDLGTFIKLMGVYPPGSAVQLTDDRHALVVAVNTTRPLKPRVLVHAPSVPRHEALVLDLESVPGLGIRRSVKPQQLPPAAFEYLSPRPRMAYFFEPVAAPPLAN